MKKTFSLLTLLFISTFSGACIAEANSNPYYITINGGVSKLSNRCTNLASGFTCKDSALAYSLDGGYQSNKYFGFEFAFAIYGAPKTSGTVSGSNLDVAEEVSGFRFSGTASLPVTDSFALTGRLGYAQTNIKVISIVSPGPGIPNYSAGNSTLTYGAGIKYNINKTIALCLQYDNLGEIGDDVTGKHNLSLISVGLSYYFNVAKPSANENKSLKNKPDAQANSPAIESPLRVILYLGNSPAENKPELNAAIAQACQCQPYFVRIYNNHAIVYQINLAPGQTFSSFKDTLLLGDTLLDMKDLTLYQ